MYSFKSLVCLSLIAIQSASKIHGDEQSSNQSPVQSSDYETNGHREHIHKRIYSRDVAKDESLINQVMSVISPSEVELLKQDQPIATSPLAYEVRISDLWNLGYQEATKQSKHNMRQFEKVVMQMQPSQSHLQSQSQSVSESQSKSESVFAKWLPAFLTKHAKHAKHAKQDENKGEDQNESENASDVKQLLESVNKNNTFVIDAQTMCQQIMWAYQLGGLNVLNKQLGTKYIVPYQKASPKQIEKLLQKDQHKGQFRHAFESKSKSQLSTMTESEENVSEMEEMNAFETLGNESFDESLFNSYAVKADE